MIFVWSATNCLAGIILLCAFLQLAQQRMMAMLTLSQISALALGFVAVLQGLKQHAWWFYLLAAMISVAQFLAFPWALQEFVRRFNVKLAPKRGLPLALSLMVGVVAVFLAVMGGLPLARQFLPVSGGALSLAMAVTLLGVWLIILHSDRLAQMIGFVTFENGLALALIYTPGLGWGAAIALIGLLVLVTGMALFRIGRHYADSEAAAGAVS